MKEIFKPRKNMTYNAHMRRYECRDQDGKCICDGGPSIIWDDGYWEFYTNINGHHRLDGPATSIGIWMVNNKNVTKKIKKFARRGDIDLKNLTDADKVMIALKFG